MAKVVSTKKSILHRLKTKGPQKADALAKVFKVTSMAVRQHLHALLDDGLVSYEDRAKGRGRPSRFWQVTDAADAYFPESHTELALDVLQGIRESLGEEAMSAVIKHRAEKQLKGYRDQLKGTQGLADKVKYLADQRSREGYMATWFKEGDAYYLAENHCPICAAAQTCVGLCESELDVFKRALGKGVKIEREEHIITGARRCLYRIEG